VKTFVSDLCPTGDRCTSNNVLTCSFVAKTLFSLLEVAGIEHAQLLGETEMVERGGMQVDSTVGR